MKQYNKSTKQVNFITLKNYKYEVSNW